MGKQKKLPKIEFKSGDNAWYDVALEIKGSYLKVHYAEFPEEEDEELPLDDFKSVEEFRSRFRFSSTQLQDQHCEEVEEGMDICASCSSDGLDVKFFDAVVQQVYRSKHQVIDREESCTCTFKVLWKTGPNAYKATVIRCENVCLLTPGNIESHPIIKAFMKLIEEKFDCKVQSLGRNPLKKNAEKKGSNKTNNKDKQGQPGKTSNGVSASDLENSCIISGQERVENVSDTGKENVAIDRPKNTIEAVFPSANEVADSTLHLASVSQYSTMEKKSDDVLNAVENVVNDSKVFLQQSISSSNEVENPVISGSHMASERNISSYSHNKNDITMPKSTDKATLHANIFSECKATHFNSVRKDEKFSLDLNSMPVELETEQITIPTSAVGLHSSILTNGLSQSSHSHVGYFSPNWNNAKIDANNTNRKDNRFLEWENNIGITENQRPCHSGWLETEKGDMQHNENSGVNVLNNEITSKSACLTAEIINQGSKLSEDNLLSADGGMKRSSSSLVMDNWDRVYNCERGGQQLTVGENQKDKEITEDTDGKKVFLASSWGKRKRQKYTSNEIFASERQVHEYSKTRENVKASKNLTQYGNDIDGVDTLSSRCLTTSNLKHSTNHNTMESLNCSTDVQGLADQNLEDGEKTGKCLRENKQPVKHIISDEVPTWEVPLEVGGISYDNKTSVSKLQSDVSCDINAPRSSCLSASVGKVNIRNDSFDSFRDSSDHPDQTVKNVTKHEKLKRKEKSSPGFLAEALDISSDEDDHGTSQKICADEILGLGRQHSNHVQLQEGLSTTERIKEDGTFKYGHHTKVQSINEYNPIYTCESEGQKNVRAIQHHCNCPASDKTHCYSSDHSDATDMPSFRYDHILEKRQSHFTCKEHENARPSSFKVHSRPSESYVTQICSKCNHHRTCSGNSFTIHCERSSESSVCRCAEQHSCDVSASSEDESIFDGEVTGCTNVSGCKNCRKYLKSVVSSKRAIMRFCRDPHKARCGCINSGCEHVRTEEAQFYHSEVVVLDNLEKDVSPSDVKKVLSSVTCGVVGVYILPSLKFEQFTRGFVWFQDHASLVKALCYLQDDDIFIISSNGRPWVVLHIDNGGFEGLLGGFNIQSKESKQYCAKTSSSSKLLIVHKGTDTYEKAKMRKNAFLEFREHLAILHKRLDLEERQCVLHPGND